MYHWTKILMMILMTGENLAGFGVQGQGDCISKYETSGVVCMGEIFWDLVYVFVTFSPVLSSYATSPHLRHWGVDMA